MEGNSKQSLFELNIDLNTLQLCHNSPTHTHTHTLDTPRAFSLILRARLLVDIKYLTKQEMLFVKGGYFGECKYKTCMKCFV